MTTETETTSLRLQLQQSQHLQALNKHYSGGNTVVATNAGIVQL